MSSHSIIFRESSRAWLTARPNKVDAKGKGAMQTYWCEPHFGSGPGSASEFSRSEGISVNNEDPSNLGDWSEKSQSLVRWNCEMLLKLLNGIATSRSTLSTKGGPKGHFMSLKTDLGCGKTVLDEVTEVISLPSFNSNKMKLLLYPKEFDVGSLVKDQLFAYLSFLASTYRNNSFHNFEHASHVAMSVNKLLSRIVAPKEIDTVQPGSGAAQLHDRTYGITSDPLTQFAVVFSALIHDADHRGVPNGQLAKEDKNLASAYKNKSVAEQNSVDVSWNALMGDEYSDLLACICSNQDELKRFRQIVVNTVMATDIFDKELSELRKNRWDKAFDERISTQSNKADDVNRKATIALRSAGLT